MPTLQVLQKRLQHASEPAIVSTCNRTEVYVGSTAEAGGVPAALLHRHGDRLEDAGTARHAFRLASGLASMVIGETQILGQMKDAVREAGTLGATLHQLFQRFFAIAKEARSGTGIGTHTVSLAAAILRQADRLFEDFSALNVLFVGAGEMAAPALAHVAARRPARLSLANRSVERGRALAKPFGAATLELAELPTRLAEFDLVISCTASTLPLIGLGAVASAIKTRRRRLMMVDLAAPRDIEAEVADLADVYLYTLDDLAQIVQAGSDRRAAAVGQAETIIETGVQDFVRWLDTRETVPLIQALQTQTEAWRAVEPQRAHKLLARGAGIDDVLEALSRGLTQKMMHGPMASLRGSGGGDRAAPEATLFRLFLRCGARNRRTDAAAAGATPAAVAAAPFATANPPMNAGVSDRLRSESSGQV